MPGPSSAKVSAQRTAPSPAGASTTLPLYWELASVDASVRTKAATSLLQQLLSFQADLASSQKSTASIGPLGDDTLEIYCAKDVAYALRRLFRGLASSREGARQGFSLALTELLASLPFFTLDYALDLLESSTEYPSSATGQEERDALFGRVFGLMCIAEAGLPARPATPTPVLERLFTLAATLARAKPYLREPATQALLSSIPALHAANAAALPLLAQSMLADGIHTPEALQIALTLQLADPFLPLDAYTPSWESGALLQTGNIPHLAPILRESSIEDPALYSTWHPQLHSVWTTLLDLYFPDPQMTELAPFSDLWLSAVDEGLFGPSISPEHKYWGFQLLDLALSRLPHTAQAQLFTPHLLRTLVTQLSGADRALGKRARQSLDLMVSTASRHQEARFALASALVGPHGHRHFDRVTKTRTIQTLLTQEDTAGIDAYLDYLVGLFSSATATDDDHTHLLQQQKWAVDQMLGLVRNSRVPREESWLRRLLRFLSERTLDVTELAETRILCRDRLYSLLTELSTSPPPAPVAAEEKLSKKGKRFHGRISASDDADHWLTIAAATLRDISSPTPTPKKNKRGAKAVADTPIIEDPVIVLSADALSALDTAIAAADALAKRIPSVSSPEERVQLDSLHQLLTHEYILLRTLNGISEEEGIAALDDLLVVIDKLHPAKPARATKKKASKKEESEEEPEAISVLVDLILSFLSRGSLLMRSLAEHTLVSHALLLSPESVALMVRVIEEGEGPAEGEAEEEDEEESEEEDATSASAPIDIDIDEDDEDEDEEEEEEGVSSEEESDEESEDEMNSTNPDDEMTARIRAALGDGVATSDNDEDEDVDDAGMTAFDGPLEEVFRQRKLARVARQSATELRRHLQLRVCGLLEGYGKATSASGSLTPWSAIVPLLRRAGAGGAVGERCIVVIREGWVKPHPKGASASATTLSSADEDQVSAWMADVVRVGRSRGDVQLVRLCGAVWRALARLLPADKALATGLSGLAAYLAGEAGRGGGREGFMWEEIVPVLALLTGLPGRLATITLLARRGGDPASVRAAFTVAETYKWLNSLLPPLSPEAVAHPAWEDMVKAIATSVASILRHAARDTSAPSEGAVILNTERLKSIIKIAVHLLKRLRRLDPGASVLFQEAGLKPALVEAAVTILAKDWMRIQGAHLSATLVPTSKEAAPSKATATKTKTTTTPAKAQKRKATPSSEDKPKPKPKKVAKKA